MEQFYTTVLFGSLLSCSAAFAQTPVLLKDINPTGSSSPGGLTCFGGVTYFNANDGVHGIELWKTDGTESGTVLVKDIVEGTGNSNARAFFEIDGTIYFTTGSSPSDAQLWKTDGTGNGTQMAVDFTQVDGLLGWNGFAKFGDLIYFQGRTADEGTELWYTDGTVAGTHMLLDLRAGTTGSSPRDLIEFQGHLFFNAANNDLEPWMTDGTPEGTVLLKDCYEGIGSSDPTYYKVVDDQLFFRAETGAESEELWVTDGTTDGTNLVRDLYPGTNSSLPSNFAAHNGELYFRAYPGDGNSYIFHSDGTFAGTVALPQPAYDYTLAEGMCSHNGWLYFLAYGDLHKQLWRTDGTAAGTEEILYPGTTPIQPMANAYTLTSCGPLLFRAGYIEAIGDELFAIDPSVGMDTTAPVHISLFPNPTSGQLRVSGFPANSNFALYTTDGRMVLNTAASPTMDVTTLPNAPYVARITDAEGTTIRTQLLLVQH